MENSLQKQLKNLEKLKDYFCLVESNDKSFAEIVDILGNDIPVELANWLKIYNGGNLFGISMFSTKEKEEGKFNKLLTFKEVNSKEMKEQMQIPEELKIFAQTNYGSYYCFVSGENTQCVYEYDTEEQALTVKWDSFVGLLSEIIENAKNDIKDGFLDKIEK